jgi:predicted nucleotidyltransferase component of viral defense system
MKNLTQIKDLIKNEAKKREVIPQILLRNYMMERLLERIALSEFKENFILKGGMLIGALVGVNLRTTVDMDATIKALPVTKEKILSVFNFLAAMDIEDGVKFRLKTITDIRAEDKYVGFRLSLVATIESAKIPIKIDISTGDKITPKEIEYSFKLLLENRSIEILSYNIETILAEKFETILSRGTANTRMRDFYDIYILLKTQRDKINSEILRIAINKTMVYRNSTSILQVSEQIINEIFSDKALERSWVLYQNKYKYPKQVSWEKIKSAILSLKNH